MKSLKKVFLFVSLLATDFSSALPESINPPTIPQTAPLTAGERKNLDLVLHWWQEVVCAHHLDLAQQYLPEHYIEHDPNIPTDRGAFTKAISQAEPQTDPFNRAVSNAPVVQGAKGDFVWLVFEQEAKDPLDASKTYRYNSIQLVRTQDGKIQEHWDSEKKRSGSPALIASKAVAPYTRNTGKLSASEQRNLSLATQVLKDLLQYGHLELADTIIDPAYIQHNPNVPQGSEGLKRYMSGFHVPVETIKTEWKHAPVMSLVSGPYVLMMWNEKEKDPSDPGKDYTWNHFDVIRIEKGLIKEHWDEEGFVLP